MKVACLPNTCSASDIPFAKTRIGQRATKETVLVAWSNLRGTERHSGINCKYYWHVTA